MNKSFSQHGEDILLVKYFENKIGIFLDLGANDGITLSNTYLFYLNGWKGVMVEGSPFVFERLKKNFENSQNIDCLNICLSDKDGFYNFYRNIHHHVNPNISKENMDLLSTIDDQSYERAKNWGTFEQHKIFCHTFEEVIKKTKYRTFDLISIDIEGMDFRILKQIDLNKTETKCLIIEYNNNIEEREKIIEHCSNFGLSKILLDNKTNIVLVR